MNRRMKIRIYRWQRSLRKSCQKLRSMFQLKTQMHRWILFIINWKSLWTWKKHLLLKLLLNWNKIVHTQECSFNSTVLYNVIHISSFSVESSRSEVDARRSWVVKNVIKLLWVAWAYEKKNENEDADICNVNIELLQYWRLKVSKCFNLEWTKRNFNQFAKYVLKFTA